MPYVLTTLAETYGLDGQPEEGLKRAAEAIALLERTQERWAEAETYRVRGTLLLSMHDQAAAEDSFHKALAVAQRQSARFWELRAALDLSRLWRDQGKRSEARDLLAPIYGWFTEGFDTPVLQEAKSLLDELRAHGVPRPWAAASNMRAVRHTFQRLSSRVFSPPARLGCRHVDRPRRVRFADRRRQSKR
jgi:predicted ATPase